MKRGNPNHYPKGHPKGGQFAPKGYSAAHDGYAHRTYDEIEKSHEELPIEMFDKIRGRKAMQIQEDIGGSFESAVYIAGAIEDYSGHAYKQVRKYQRGESQDANIANDVKALEWFIRKAPQWKGGTVYRGLRKSDRYDVSVGSIIDMGGMSSWTSNADVIPRFTNDGGTVFVSDDIGVATSIKAYSRWEEEDEVLSSGENLYMVTKVETKQVLFDGKSKIPFDTEPGMKTIRFVYVTAIR